MMIKKGLVWLVAVLLLALTSVVWAQSKIPPKPYTDIYCQDQANLLNKETKQKINDISSRLAAKTKAQVVVLTVPNLGGAPLEEYSLEVLRQWGIGDRKLNNGVLLLLAVEERHARIEVGYGLEGALPDGKTGRMMGQYLIPQLQKGDYNKGIYDTYMALLDAVCKEYNVEINGVEPRPVDGELDWQVLVKIACVIILFLIIDWFFFRNRISLFILQLLSSGKGSSSNHHHGGGGDGFGGGSGGGGGSSRPW